MWDVFQVLLGLIFSLGMLHGAAVSMALVASVFMVSTMQAVAVTEEVSTPAGNSSST